VDPGSAGKGDLVGLDVDVPPRRHGPVQHPRAHNRGNRWHSPNPWATRSRPDPDDSPNAVASSATANSLTHGHPSPPSGIPVS
jgi:hypothetical protein